MTFPRKYTIITPAQVQDCIASGMSVRRMAEVLNCSESGLRQACSLFGWSPHGHSGPKPNQRMLQPRKRPGTQRGAHNPFAGSLA